MMPNYNPLAKVYIIRQGPPKMQVSFTPRLRQNTPPPYSLRRLDSDLTPIRLRPILLRTGFSRPVPLSSSARADSSQPPGDSALIACPRGKQPASLAGNQSSRATMGDPPVQDVHPRAAPSLASTEHPRSKESSRLTTNYRNGSKIHRNEPPYLIPSPRANCWVKVIDPDDQLNPRPHIAVGIHIPTRAI